MKTTRRSKNAGGVGLAGIACLLLLATTALYASAAEGKKGDKKEAAAPQPYPLDTCLVSGKKLPAGTAPVAIVHDGRTINFCCRDCVAAFKKNPGKYLAKLDEALIAKQKKTYPLTTCPVNGAKLGAMGKTIDYLYHGRLVRFCCRSCLAQFKKTPASYLRQLDAAAAAAKKRKEAAAPQPYPLDTCLVSGKKLPAGAAPVAIVHDGRTIKFCCRDCVAAFKKHPGKYLAKLDEALIAKQKKTYPLTTCPVSGAKLGAMGKTIDYLHHGRLVRFCCRGCLARFKKNPAPYLRKLDAAVAAAKKRAAKKAGGE